MPKVFRLYKEGDNKIVDWKESREYIIDKIEDPDGATAEKEITSIPSPFARIDLVKTAFKEVVSMARNVPDYDRLGREQLRALVEKGGQKKPTIYHKMVSDALDVGEIFFNFDRFSDKFDIIVWDKEKDLDTENIFGKTLRLFLDSDSQGKDTYNLGKMKRIYMLNYKGPDRLSNMNIVGATSPATMFFSSANDVSYIAKHVAFGEDKPFDEFYNPLFRRDIEYQKYLFVFREEYGKGDFARDFPEVNDYLEIIYRCLDDNQKNQIEEAKQNGVGSYEKIKVGDSDSFEILGKPFHKKSKNIKWKSDFEINSTVYKDDKNPLVLPVESGNQYESLTYTTDKFGNKNKAKYFDETEWKKRRLPVVNDEYPYLTISDFLSYELVKMPYGLNSDKFYGGGYVSSSSDENEKDSYLLPLTDLFFKFFTVSDLMSDVAGKKMFEIKEVDGGVEVVLRIPIQKGYVEYSRIYFPDLQVDKDENDGVIIEEKIGLGIMPFIRFPESVDKNYRVAFFDKVKDMDAKLFYYEGTSEVESEHRVRADKDLNGRGCSHESYMITKNFDRIKVSFGAEGKIVGFIVPKFKKETVGNTEFTFAVDFGTTNTHIEYCTDANGNAKPFDIAPTECQLIKMHNKYTDADIRLSFEQDFIPETIGDNPKSCSFPIRTVYAERIGVDYNQTTLPLCDGNIPFMYERERTQECKIRTELKWGGEESLLRMHLETIFILMRNKVLLNNGNLSATKIIWFYPASMTRHSVGSFNTIWKNSYEKYFGPKSKENVISISESKAPYIHFIKRQGAADEVVTIDVGGGTTDVFVAEGGQDKMLLSFRYASNAVFGDAYNSNPSKNGFVCRYLDEFKEILKTNSLLELSETLKQIEQQQKSSDIIAFLFSLVGEKVKSIEALDFLKKLTKDDSMKYVFIIFYGSILYFVANVMKAKGLKKPKTIAFSGNGAKTIRILSDEDELIGRYAKLIFDKIYGDNNGTIEFMMEKNPKVSTCKGGIELPERQDYDEIDNIKTIFVGNKFDANADDKHLAYNQINDEVKKQVLESVHKFFEILFELHNNNKDFFVNYLGANSDLLNEVKEFCTGEESKQTLEDSLSKGLKHKFEVDKVKDDTKLEETLFFYPLVRLLNDLAYKIATLKK